MDLITHMDENTDADFSLSSKPTFTANFISATQLGEFEWLNHPATSPYPATPLPLIAGTGMFRILVSDYVPNTAGWVYWREGRLQSTVKDARTCGVLLNTGWFFFRAAVPQLYQKYPDKPIQLEVAATSGPVVKIAPSGAEVLWKGEVRVGVLTGEAEPPVVATIAVEMRTSASGQMQGFVFVPQVGFIGFQASVTESSVGPIDVSRFRSALECLCAKGIVPYVNSGMAKGVKLPSVDGFRFVSPAVAFESGFFVISGNLDYSRS